MQAALKVQTKKSSWILDSRCTSYMIEDKTKLSNMNNFNGGSIKFGNNDDDKIVEKGYVSLNGGKILCDNVLYVDGLKHNLLSVSQLCKDGHKVIFLEKGCVIRSIETGKQIGKEKKIFNNLYVLDEHNGDICNENPAKPLARDVFERLRTLLGVVPSH